MRKIIESNTLEIIKFEQNKCLFAFQCKVKYFIVFDAVIFQFYSKFCEIKQFFAHTPY